MKIWYQSFSVGSASPDAPYPRILRESVAALLDADTTITFGPMRKTISQGHHLRSIQSYDLPELFRSLLTAEQVGYDAVIIGNALDPGLYEAKQLLRIPVLSIGHTAIMYSQLLGTKALLIVSGKKAIPLVQGNVERYGLSRQVHKVVAGASDLSVPQMLGAFEDDNLKDQVLDAFFSGVKAHLTDEVEVVLPMTGILQVLLHHAKVTEIEGRPVVNGFLVTPPIAELAAKLHKLGISTSNHGVFAPIPPDLQKALASTWPEFYPRRGDA